MFLGLILPNSFNHLLIAFVKAILAQRNSAHKTISVSLYWSFLNYKFPNNHLYFQHVVLVGGFASSDWLFFKVYELLTPLGLNIVRPENHVWVLFEVKTTVLFKKSPLETKLHRMARSHSTSTTSWGLVFLKSHMVPFPIRHTSQVTQTTDHDLTRSSPVLLGKCKSQVSSKSFYQKWAG